MGLPDIVYVVREGDNNDELRYSLRSLVNVPHGNVWLVGHRPRWAANVLHIPVRQNCGSKYRNSTANMRAACEHPDVSGRFVYFNDDFYVMEPLTEVPALNRGKVADALRKRPATTQYVKGAKATDELLHSWGYPEPWSFELHVPMLVDKNIMLDCLDRAAKADILALHKRTLYGNVAGLVGETIEDVKVHSVSAEPKPGPFLSSNDRSFKGKVGAVVRRSFPKHSPYENGRR